MSGVSPRRSSALADSRHEQRTGDGGGCCRQCRMPSLFDIVTLYVARNLTHVESFIGFPAAIAAELFDAALQCGAFDEPSVATSVSLAKLSDAYGADFASSLNLAGLRLGERRLISCFAAASRGDAPCAAPAAAAIFANVRACRFLASLDLGSCRLGESEPLFLLARDCLLDLHCLTSLGLRDNALNDKHLWSLTRPSAVLGKGLVRLERLDLTDNELTAIAVRHLTALGRIRVVWLSGNLVSRRMYEERCTGLPYRPAGSEAKGELGPGRVDMLGWGVVPFERWAAAAAAAAIEPSDTPSFYSPVSSEARLRRRGGEGQPTLTLVRAEDEGAGQLPGPTIPSKKARLASSVKKICCADAADYFAAYL